VPGIVIAPYFAVMDMSELAAQLRVAAHGSLTIVDCVPLVVNVSDILKEIHPKIPPQGITYLFFV
jgi:hypothetical protein